MDSPPEPYDDGAALVDFVFGSDPEGPSYDELGDSYRPVCPDDGACHHSCAAEDGCWRARYCSPLSAYGETWPTPPAGGSAMSDTTPLLVRCHECGTQWDPDAEPPRCPDVAGHGLAISSDGGATFHPAADDYPARCRALRYLSLRTPPAESTPAGLPTVPLPFQGPAATPLHMGPEAPIHEVLGQLRTWVAVTLRDHLHGAAGTDWDPEHPDTIAYHEDVDIQVDRMDPRLYALQRTLFDAYPNDIPEPDRPDTRPEDLLRRVYAAAGRPVHVHDVSSGRDITITAVASDHGRNFIGGHTFRNRGENG
jgi:hypothetical protein